MEIVVEKVFTALKIGTSSGPEIAIFQCFREKWQWIDQTVYQTAEGMPEISSFRQSSISFALQSLQSCQPRDDYREMLELVLIFLGSAPVRGIHFLAPGALHCARWMARIIYSYQGGYKSRFFLIKIKKSDFFDLNRIFLI